jgi:hypothetical protein
MKHFLFETKEYEIDPRFRSPKRKREQSYSLKALRKLWKHIKTGGGSGGGGKRLNDTRQHCTVKAQYSRSFTAHKEQLEKYLSREGTGKDGGQAELYGTPQAEYRSNMTAKNFRIFLSPASNKIKLEVLAKTFIKKVELQTGLKLYWQAAEHYNTAHPHVHLLINGRDQNGKDVFFPRDVIKTFMRESARDICTSLIGSRTRADMEQEAKAVLEANRFTRLDEAMKAYVIEGNVHLDWIKKNRERYVKRLDHLKKLGLCEWKGTGYILSPEWEESLKAAGKYNSFLNAKKHLAYSGKLSVYASAQGKKTGRVAKVYRTDEVSDNHAVVLESLDGNAWFIPLFAKPPVKEGETVTVIPEKNQKGRLTPVFKKTDIRELYQEAERNGYQGAYAQAVRNEYAASRNAKDKGIGV